MWTLPLLLVQSLLQLMLVLPLVLMLMLADYCSRPTSSKARRESSSH
jgi:hypothetical protein